MVLKNVLLLGGSGTLGKELLKINSERKDCILHAPPSWKINIENMRDSDHESRTYVLDEEIDKLKIDLVVNCAALTNVSEIEKDSRTAINVNTIGACNVLIACITRKIKLVHISTDHVFDGKLGQYKTDDAINPLTKYAKTKAAAELCVRTYENSLVIRTSFFGHKFPFEKAFVDQFSSKDYVDIIAPKVYDAMLGDKTGIIHVASKRRSLYEIAKERNAAIVPASIAAEERKYPSPKDTSLFLMEENNDSAF